MKSLYNRCHTGLATSVFLAVAAAAATIVGCGSNDDARQPATKPLASFAEVYEGIEYDVAPYRSLEDVKHQSTLIVDGTWEQLVAGRTLSEDLGDLSIDNVHAVARIEVDRVLHGELLDAEGSFAYLEVRIPATSSLEDAQRVYPAGERVVAAIQEWDPSVQPEGIIQTNVQGGHPEGTRLMTELPNMIYMDGNEPYRLPIPAAGQPIQVDSLDEVAAFLSAG